MRPDILAHSRITHHVEIGENDRAMSIQSQCRFEHGGKPFERLQPIAAGDMPDMIDFVAHRGQRYMTALLGDRIDPAHDIGANGQHGVMFHGRGSLPACPLPWIMRLRWLTGRKAMAGVCAKPWHRLDSDPNLTHWAALKRGGCYAAFLFQQIRGATCPVFCKDTDMAKPATVKIRLVSTADTGFFYVTKKNPRTKTEKFSFRKYDPVVRKHVEFKEAKIK